MDILGKPVEYFATLDSKSVLGLLKTKETGLSGEEARKRIASLGKNIIVEEKRVPLLFQFLKNFKNPLVLILLFAASISFALSEVINGIIIGIIVIFSTILNFFQEYSAGRAADKLKERLAISCIVLRSGEKETVSMRNVAVGDVILLEAGDLIPADCRMLSAKDFFVNEAAVTGESFPVEKAVDVYSSSKVEKSKSKTAEEFSINSNSNINIVFSGTHVVTGAGNAVVLKTGVYTEIGKIGRAIEKPAPENDFSKGIQSFSFMILKITLFFVVFIFFINATLKHNIIESFTFAVAIAVGLTPELLPVIMSVTMSKGSLKMAKKGTLVKKLTAIPTFGSMDVLCTDKTGTLTEAKIAVVKYVNLDGDSDERVLMDAYVNSYYQTGVRDPMNIAILDFKKEAIKDYGKIDEIPFDFQRKRTSVVVSYIHKTLLITKGAPDDVFAVSKSFLSHNVEKKFDAAMKKQVVAQYQKLCQDGFRVLAVAKKEIRHPGNPAKPEHPGSLSEDVPAGRDSGQARMTNKNVYSKDDEKDLILTGFVAFLDPVKKDVKDVIQRLENMGIEVKVITGDNEIIAQKICRDAGLPLKGLLVGSALERLSEKALKLRVEHTTLFAQCNPEQKSRIIGVLKANGHVVGYMGDGINDAPPLHTADVGISVENGVDVAKEEAEIILTHKSLKELEEGVLEGRKTFGNTMKYILMGLSSNFGNMFSVLVAVVFLPFLPMLPIQILLNNFLYDLSQVTIPSDSVDQEYLVRPKRWDIGFIKKFMFVFGPVSSVFDLCTFYVLFSLFHVQPAVFQTAWFLESLATQALVIYVIRTRKIPFIQSRPSMYLIISTIFCVTIGWLLPYSPFGQFFGFAKVPQHVLLILGGIIGVYLLTVELVKQTVFRKQYM